MEKNWEDTPSATLSDNAPRDQVSKGFQMASTRVYC